MNKSNLNALLVLAAIGIVIFLGWLFYYNITPKYEWDENFKKDGKSPYGINVFYELLKNTRSEKDFINLDTSLNQLIVANKSKASNQNYILFGDAQSFDDSSAAVIKHFVENGNNAFIISKFIPHSINRVLKIGRNQMRYWVENVNSGVEDSMINDTTYYNSTIIDTTIFLKPNNDTHYDTIIDSFIIVKKDTTERYLIHKEFYFSSFIFSTTEHEAQLNYVSADLKNSKNWSYDYFVNNGFVEYEWNSFHTANFSDSIHFDSLSVLDDQYPCMIRIKIGKGYLYMHVIPMAFTNYNLTEERKFDYVNGFVSFFNSGKIYWDECSLKQPKNNNDEVEEHGTPLQYIFANRSLKWAWYTGLLAILLYLIFHIKRKLPVLNVKIPKQNTSLDFLKNISLLYFNKKSHHNIALKKWKLFNQFLLHRYGERTDDMDEVWIEKLAKKSGVNAESIKSLVGASHNNLMVATYTSKNLIELHQLLQYFYENCK
jgi:hypothetical protein